MLVSLRNQWPHVKGNAFYEAQYRKGRTFWRGYYGEMLFLDLQLRPKSLANLRRCLRDLGYLIYYPAAIALRGFSRLQKFAARFGLIQRLRMKARIEAHLVALTVDDNNHWRSDWPRVKYGAVAS